MSQQEPTPESGAHMIYVVEGSTGEYSDRYEWPVAAYRTREAAQSHATAAQAEADRIRDEVGDRYRGANGHENPYDPEMSMDYSGVYYGVWEVELRESFAPIEREAP